MTLTVESTCYAVKPDQVNRPEPYEADFYEYLTACGEVFEREPLKLLHQPYVPGQVMRGMTPDVRLARQVDGFTVYIELTSGDRYPEAMMLPAKVRRHNRRYSQSGQEHVPPATYESFKRMRIADTYAVHRDVVIILLNCAKQEEVRYTPGLLDELIAAEVAKRLRAQAA